MSKKVVSTTQFQTPKGDYTVICDAHLQEVYRNAQETGECEVILEDILIKNDTTGEVIFLRGLTAKNLEFIIHCLRSTREVKELLIERYEDRLAKKKATRKGRAKTTR